jgi:hypothetical protein
MADQNSPFERQALESDMKRLAEEVNNQRSSPEMRNSPERELLKEAIRAFPRFEKNESAAVPPPAPQPVTPPAPQGAAQSILPDYAKDAAPEVKLEIEYLLDIALSSGLQKALAEADKSPYFVRDAFHDALAGKLYPVLQKKGLIK